MNRASTSDIINIFYEKYGRDNGVTKKNSELAVKNTIEAIKDAIVNYGYVSLQGFGTIKVKDVPETNRIYTLGPNKGEEYVVPAHKTLKMKFSKNVVELVN